jgi:hypothetical protein
MGHRHRAVRSFLPEERLVAAIPGATDAYLDDANGLSWSSNTSIS